MYRVARWFSSILLLLPLVLTAGLVLAPAVETIGTLTLAFAFAVGLYGFHRGLSYAEARGWMYYRNGRGTSGALSATSEWLNLYDPSRRHVLEALKEPEWKRDEDDDGEGKA